ncbi:MAG: DUF898 family protein [Ectothiorhodospiraceae bacterium AqS1]|nr:DUF898 family protein [Ectothiorhodospiraceae bacterium AqS1]
MSDPNHSSDQARITQDIAPESAPAAASEPASHAAPEFASPEVSESAPPADSNPAPSTALVPVRPTTIPITFGGTAEQYFDLYITNTLLTIITIGIYGPWARVRTRRFFAGHTHIGRHNLEFDARPVDILVSRIVIVAISALVIYIEYLFDLFWSGIGIFLILTLLLMPVALVRGRAFIAQHTIHRTVRFRYRLEYRGAAALFLGYALLLIPLSYSGNLLEDSWAGLFSGILLAALIALFILPLLRHLDHRTQIGQLHFGRLRFSFAGRLGRYYRGWGVFLLVGILLTVVLLGIIGFIAALSGSPYPVGGEFLVNPFYIAFEWFFDSGLWGQVAFGIYSALIYAVYRILFTDLYRRSSFRIGKKVWVVFLSIALLLTIAFLGVIRLLNISLQFANMEFPPPLMYWLFDSGLWGLVALGTYLVFIYALYRSVFTCLYWRSFRIGEDSAIESDLDWRLYARLLVGNYMLIVLSVGLMYPWARVRDYRYVAERLRLRLGPKTVAGYSSHGDDLTALAGEFSDISGWDFGFGRCEFDIPFSP